MKFLYWLSPFAVGAAVAAFSPGKPQATAGQAPTVERRPSRVIRELGVCAIDAEGASCWTNKGVRDAALSKRANALLAQPNVQVSFVRGRKNRYVAIEQEPVYSLTVQSEHGPSTLLPAASPIRETADQFNFIAIDAPNEAKIATIVAEIRHRSPRSPVIPAEPGRKFVNGEEYEIGPSVLDPALSAPNSRPEMPAIATRDFPIGPLPFEQYKMWRIAVGKSGESLTSPNPPFEVLDRLGKLIEYFDAPGAPVDVQTANQLRQEAMEARLGGRFAERHVWATRLYPDFSARPRPLQSFAPPSVPKVPTYLSPVDPDYIGFYRWVQIDKSIETIGPLLLDPN